MRVKNTILNGCAGILNQTILLALNFVSRRVFIDSLGVEYLGLNGLFSNILAMLSLAELGVGTAIIYNLYKPLAEDNKEEVCGLMNLYKNMYRWIALAITGIGLILTFFIPYIIKNITFDMNYIRVIYLLFLTNTAVSYLVAYKRSLLYADQKNYIVIKWDMFISVVGTLVKVALLVITRNYIIYLLLQIAFSIIPNIVVAHVVNKKYPYIVNNQVRLETHRLNSIGKDIKNLFIHKLASFIVFSTDNIIISTFIGISTVGLFSNYSLIITTLEGFINQLLGGIQSSLGNLATSESKEKVLEVFKKLNFLSFWVGSFCAVSLYVLIHDFIGLWIGDMYTVRDGAIELAILNMILMIIARPIWQLMTVSGLFKQDKTNAIIEMVLNLVLSLVLVKVVGLPGVFLGTTLSYIVAWGLKTRTIFKYYLEQSSITYYIKELIYVAVIILEICLARWIAQQIDIINAYALFIIEMVICVLVPNIINIVLFYKTDEFKYFLSIGKKIFSRKAKD